VAVDIFEPVINIKGIGPSRARLFETMGIFTVNDVLWFFPRRYTDRREICKISELQPDRSSVTIARVKSISIKRSFRTGSHICSCQAEDDTGTVSLIWFNRKGLNNILKEGTSLSIFGLPSFSDGKIEFLNPDFEVINYGSDVENFVGIVPVYPSTAGLPVRWFRKFVRKILENYLPLIPDYLPQSIMEKRNLQSIGDALWGMHWPESEDHWKNSRKRLAYEEFIFLQTALVLRKERLRRGCEATKIFPNGCYYSRFLNNISFELTASQKLIFAQIFKDTKNGHPMSRLLQGDVGSGKTVIALGLALSSF